MSTTKGFPKHSIIKLIQSEGVERVNKDAVETLKRYLDDVAYSVTGKAAKVTLLGNRKRTTKNDMVASFEIISKRN